MYSSFMYEGKEFTKAKELIRSENTQQPLAIHSFALAVYCFLRFLSLPTSHAHYTHYRSIVGWGQQQTIDWRLGLGLVGRGRKQNAKSRFMEQPQNKTIDKLVKRSIDTYTIAGKGVTLRRQSTTARNSDGDGRQVGKTMRRLPVQQITAKVNWENE
jgi:hypothetical protein